MFKPQKTLADKLFKHVLLIYIFVAIFVVTILFYIEFTDTKSQVLNDLKKLEQAQTLTLSTALWNMDIDNLQTITNDLYQHDVVTSIVIYDVLSKDVLVQVGSIANDKNSNYQHSFRIKFQHSLNNEELGFGIISTDANVIFKIIKFRVILVLSAVLSMMLALWFILQIASKKILSEPLLKLTKLSKELEFSTLNDLRVNPHKKSDDELDTLEDAFVEMVQRLQNTKQELNALHHNLEIRVSERTQSLATEIEERKSVEKALKIHSSIVTNMLDGAYLVRKEDATIIYCNNSFERMMGYKEDELIGQHISIVNAPNDKTSEIIAHKINTELAKEGIWQGEVLNQRKDGSQFWSYANIMTIDHPELGETWVSINSDISILKQQEKDLIKAKNIAEAASHAKSAFLSTMSHEIRTPMNGVMGMAQLLEDTPLNNEQKEYLNTIAESGNNLLTIINDILDFSKLDSQHVELELIEANIESLCQQCIELVAGNAVDSDISFIFDYQPECPRYFVTDPSRIRQILINLLGNALKFTSHGYVRLNVSYQKLNLQVPELCFSIEDSGTGIKEDVLPNLFSEFTQADSSTTRVFGGTGLGLAISKKIVTLMDGDIAVASTFGEGSCFSVNLPLELGSKELNQTTPKLNGVTLALYDPSTQSQKVLAHTLECMGAKVNAYHDQQDFLDHLNNVQMAILNDHNNIDIAQKIKNVTNNNDIKIISISSLKDHRLKNASNEGLFDGYLVTPFIYDELHSMLAMSLKRSSSSPMLTKYSLTNAEPAINHENLHFTGSILLVEDVLPNQMIAKKFLTNFGVEVHVVSNGLEAVNAFKENNFDLIFMDCRMPVMDGYQATREIRDYEKNNHKTKTPIIALTANASTEDRETCNLAGMDDVVTKPFKREHLSKCLKQWL